MGPEQIGLGQTGTSHLISSHPPARCILFLLSRIFLNLVKLKIENLCCCRDSNCEPPMLWSSSLSLLSHRERLTSPQKFGYLTCRSWLGEGSWAHFSCPRSSTKMQKLRPKPSHLERPKRTGPTEVQKYCTAVKFIE